MEDWSARQYLKFEDERTRPPRDLLAQVPLHKPRLAVDLGCGPGNSTELLVERFPQAEVIGLDSSPDMLRKAREDLPSPEAYYDLLKPVCSAIDIWHIVYNHVMASPEAITEWFKGSSLQPFLSPLDTVAKEKFLAAYTEKIIGAYKPRFDGKVLLRFPRLFIVAVR